MRYIMPPMSGMPPPADSFFGSSAIMASVVIKQRSNRSCVLQGCADNLDRIDDTHGDHVAEFAGLGIVAEVVGVAFEDLANDDRTFIACVFSDLANQRLKCLADDGLIPAV